MRKIVFICGLLLIITTALIIFVNSPYFYLLKGGSELDAGKIAKAQQILEQGIKKFPNNDRIAFYLSKAYFLSGEIEEAGEIILFKDVINALKKDKYFQDFLIDLSEEYNKIGNKKYSRFFSQKYLESIDDFEISKRISKNFLRVGKLLEDKSIEIWERAYNIGHALKSKEIKESTKALLLPRYFELIDELKHNKDYQKAIEVLSKAKVLGKNPEVSYQEALLYGELNNYEVSSKKFEEALQLDPHNDTYRISYANLLRKASSAIRDKNKKNEYVEKIKLLLVSGEDNPKKIKLLNNIVRLNAKYKITNANLTITMVGDYLYPSLAFKVKSPSSIYIKKYKIAFFDENKKLIDTYEAPITNQQLEEQIEVTCKMPIDPNMLVSAKLFLDGEFVKEYTNK